MEEKNRGLQWSHIEPYCLLRTLLRQLWMLLMAGAACAMAAWIVLSCFVTQQYTSSTTFAVTARASTLYYTNITAAADMASSYTQLLQSRVLRQTMEQDLGMPLDGTVTAQQLGETNLIRVTVTADTPVRPWCCSRPCPITTGPCRPMCPPRRCCPSLTPPACPWPPPAAITCPGSA